MKASGNIVLALHLNARYFKRHKLDFGNWNIVGLVYHLYNQGIACVGNVLASHPRNCKMRLDAVLKKTVEQVLNCGF